LNLKLSNKKDFYEFSEIVGNAYSASSGSREINYAIGEVLSSNARSRFRYGKGPDGKKWKQSIRSKIDGNSTLYKTGTLRSSIGFSSDSKTVKIGTNLIYAKIHQLGGVIKSKTARFLVFKIGNKFIRKKQVEIPARPFLGISIDDKKDILQIIKDYLRGKK